MQINNEAACREVVFNFCSELNQWEWTYTILRRITDGQFVSEKNRLAVGEITENEHLKAHAKIFSIFVVPRVRKYGGNPGEPKSWGSKGSFFDVHYEGIESVTFRDQNRAEVVTSYGYMLPGRRTMFILKRVSGHWLIDSLKIWIQDKWVVDYL